MTEKKAADRFWDFAITLYNKSEAREALLRLQDRDGADVPMLLWCLWCEAERYPVTKDAMKEAVAFSGACQSEMIKPLRAVRRRLKQGVPDISHDLCGAARSEIARTEQALERLQMNHLASLVSGITAAHVTDLTQLYALVAECELNADDVAITVRAL